MTFYTYMIRTHDGENTPEGDLTHGMKRDSSFPTNKGRKYKVWYKIIRDYLIGKGACTDCIKTFKTCWADYVVREKTRINPNTKPEYEWFGDDDDDMEDDT